MNLDGFGKENKSPKIVASKKSDDESVRRSARSHSKKVMRDESSSDDSNDDDFMKDPGNVFLNVSTPKNAKISKDNIPQSITSEKIRDDDQFNYLSSIVKRRPTDEFEADDFASSPPALNKRIRY